MADWEKAIDRYNHAKAGRLGIYKTVKQQRLDFAEKEQGLKIAIENAHQQFARFISRHGSQAMRLLKASGKHIVFAQSDQGGKIAVYFFGEDGLQCTFETPSSAQFYTKGEKIVPTDISPLKAAEAFALHGTIPRGENILEWFLAKLNQIANDAPS